MLGVRRCRDCGSWTHARSLAQCKKRPAPLASKGFQPTQKSANLTPVFSSAMHFLADAGSIMRTVPPNPSLFFFCGRQHFDIMTKGEKRKLHQLFACAVHRTAMSFAGFEYHKWLIFFQNLRGTFKLPSRAAIGGELMRANMERS